MMFWYGTGGGWTWWQAGLMWAGMLAFWGMLIGAVYALITGLTRGGFRHGGPGGDGPGGEDAHAILDARLARGEITPEDYQRLRALMAGEPAHTGR